MKETVMKKIFTVIVSLTVVLMFVGAGFCGEGPAKKKQHLKKVELTEGTYVAVNGGIAFLEDGDAGIAKGVDYFDDKGYAVTVAIGKRIAAMNKQVRIEGELGYQKNEVDDCAGSRCRDITGDLKAYSFLVNGYYDMVKGKKIVPYLTAGIGVAKVDADINHRAHVDDLGIAYQVGAGIAYHITDNWHIDLKYRYMGTGEVDNYKLYNTEPEFETQNVFLGIRYRF